MIFGTLAAVTLRTRGQPQNGRVVGIGAVDCERRTAIAEGPTIHEKRAVAPIELTVATSSKSAGRDYSAVEIHNSIRIAGRIADRQGTGRREVAARIHIQRSAAERCDCQPADNIPSRIGAGHRNLAGASGGRCEHDFAHRINDAASGDFHDRIAGYADRDASRRPLGPGSRDEHVTSAAR